MRFGGPVFDKSSPGAWIAALRRNQYRAAYCPVSPESPEDEVQAFVQAAEEADIRIAEVGAWSNPLSSDPEERQKALEKCKKGLTLAERVGARSCVNIAGSRGVQWDGPHPANFSSETFDMIVESVREIIDAVQPRHAFYCLETMPWIYPDSPDSYIRILQAVERPQFGVHLDPVNMISSPQRLFDNTNFLRECFAKLGPHIRSCHAKDIAIGSKLTVHLDEVRPGLGILDYRTFLTELSALDPDISLMVEHLSTEEEYTLAAEHIRSVAAQANIPL